MAFQAAGTFDDAPPGIPQVLVATAHVDLSMQILQQQMQQQQTAQQQQLQQFNDMMKHMLSMQNANLPSVGGAASSATNKVLD